MCAREAVLVGSAEPGRRTPMRKFVVALATVAAMAGGAATTTVIMGGTAIAQTPTPSQSSTPDDDTTPSAPHRRPCPHRDSSGADETPSTDAPTTSPETSV